MQGRECSEVKSKPETGLQSLGQGSRIRAWNGEGQAGSRCGVLKMGTKVCGGMGYAGEVFRMSLGRGDVWIGVPVRCYTPCNTQPLTHTMKSRTRRFKGCSTQAEVRSICLHPLRNSATAPELRNHSGTLQPLQNSTTAPELCNYQVQS